MMNDSNNTGDVQCALGGQHGDVGWFALQSLITVLNVSAIVANIFFVALCLQTAVMHRNMRLMLCNISICFAMESFAGFLYNVYFYLIGVNGFPKEPQSSWWCEAINVLMVPWDTAAVLLMVGVGIERFIATRRQVPTGAVSVYVKVIFVLVWTAAATLTVHYLFKLTRTGVCVCDGASLSDRTATFIRVIICAVLESATILLFVYVLSTSKRQLEDFGINTARYSLSKRFQVYETYRATQMLLPSAVLHAALYISYLLAVVPIRDLRASPLITVAQYNLSTIIFAFPGVHALAHPLICISRHYYLRQKTVDLIDALHPPRLPKVTLEPVEQLAAEERSRLSSSSLPPTRQSFTDGRVEFRMAPQKHHEILQAFWEKSSN